MADFISRKREIFLVQMSLDTKRDEIRKLEDRARQREEALQKSEQVGGLLEGARAGGREGGWGAGAGTSEEGRLGGWAVWRASQA